VAQGIVHQVRHEALDEARVTGARSRAEGGVDLQPPALSLRLVGQQDLPGDGRQVDALPLVEAPLTCGPG
jgi:hypothetical protein